jgi:hypothetical protein
VNGFLGQSRKHSGRYRPVRCPGFQPRRLIAGWAESLWLALLLALFNLDAVRCADAPLSQKNNDPAPTDATSLPLEPVYRLEPGAGSERHYFITRDDVEFAKLQSRIDRVAFRAVVTNVWPAGLVPVFVVERTNHWELRRRPLRGQEPGAEPIFFALPPEDEPDAVRIAGWWECHATRNDGSKDWPNWELSADRDQVFGRFDQNTQYRVAFIAGGTFRSNRIELRVEYQTDVYLLTGQWQNGMMKGEWYQVEEMSRGTWQATRPDQKIPGNKDVVPLYEWRRASGDERRYAVEDERMEPGWERVGRPLCRVWRVVEGKK